MLLKICVPFLALFVSALATPYSKRDGTISVQIKVGRSKAHVLRDQPGEGFPLTATVTNTGSKTAKILKYGTILDNQLPTKSFVVTKDGKTVPFTGIEVSISLTELGDSAFVVLAPGESVTVDHEVSNLYDFPSAGAGKFTFEPNTNFMVVDPGKSAHASGPSFTQVQASVTNSVNITVNRTVPAYELVALNSRAKDNCTDPSKQNFIDASYTEAKSLASTASSYIARQGPLDSLYRSYFGLTPTFEVARVLNSVAKENSSSRTLNCFDPLDGCEEGVIAYTKVDTTDIYFCDIFFKQLPTATLCSGTTVESRNVRGGVTLHELTHAVAQTSDLAYGCSNDQKLLIGKGVNADNYNCFATQVFANTKC